jgi:PKD repeat protein
LFTITYLYASESKAQLTVYRDVFKGGVTCGGVNRGFGGTGVLSLPLHIPDSVTIRKAFIITIETLNPLTYTIILNGNDITFDTNTIITTESMHIISSPNVYPAKTHLKDISHLVTPGVSNYTITIPQIQYDNKRFMPFYVVVTFEHPSLPVTAVEVKVKNSDVASTVAYLFEDLNPINITKDVGFGFAGDHFMGRDFDGSNVYINNQLLGLTGGVDAGSIASGVAANFAYINNTLYGLNDDTANYTMYGPDVLANIKPYLPIPFYTTQFEAGWQYDWNASGGEYTNPIVAAVLAYSTPCDTFSVFVNDTLTCYGEPVQLNVTGGQSYEWSPGYALSCTTCPNPVATPDSTVTYFLKVTNTPGCSKILPVRVYVNSPVQSGLLQLAPSDCETNTGLIKLTPATGGTPPYFYTVNGITQQANALFENLGNGTYPVLVTDGVGCTWRDTINVPATVAAQAAFTANPAEGLTPLEVNFINQSSGAQHYTWYAQADTAITFNYTHTFQQVGNYNVMLVVYNTDSTCTDTARTVIMAKTAIFIEMPSLYHPNTDGTFTLKTRGITNLKQQWFDASGRLVYNQTTNLQPGETLNNGTLQTLAAGTYLYRITATGIHNETEIFEGKVVVVR